uniref:Uncharacterized protein n=1 Tax=Anguilla anguilla TaxID=7936 RepID=A0A0E9XSI4_ANGAN
MLLNPKKRNN